MSVSVSVASAEDEPGVRRLMRTQAMPGRVQLSFCREPDFALGCAVTGDDYQILVARATAGGEVVGVACRSVRRVFLNGVDQRIGYLGQLRVHDRYRGRWLVSRGFAMLAELHQRDPLPAYLTSIVDGNAEATGVLVRKPRRGFPRFAEVAQYVTLALRIRRPKPPLTNAGQITAASDEQLPAVAAFLRREGGRRQLSAVWTAEALRDLANKGLPAANIRIARRDGTITGVLALWDQSAYKQSVIHGYSGWLRVAAPLLPRPGTQLRSAYAALLCIADDDAGVFAALLRDICNLAAGRGFEFLLVGLDARDRLLDVARACSHVAYPSRFYLASWPTGGPTHEPLDARPAYVDIATL